MGEAKARRAEAQARTWAIGSVEVVANDVECFSWSGTRQEAIQKLYLAASNAAGANSLSYAKRAAGYPIAYGMPGVGDKDRRPSSYGEPWRAEEIEVYKMAILWLALREHIPNTSQKLEDVFAGKAILMRFDGDRAMVLDATMREIRGQPFDDRDQFTMMVGVLGKRRLDPQQAVTMPMTELATLAGRPWKPLEDDLIYVPRVPINASEADAMLSMITYDRHHQT
jgi:hypothetical protein